MRDIVHMVSFYNIYTDSLPPRARSAPSRPSSSSGGPPAAARCRPCGGGTNPTTEHRDAVGRSEARLGVCIAYPGLSPVDLSTGACGAVLRSCAAPTCSHFRTAQVELCIYVLEYTRVYPLARPRARRRRRWWRCVHLEHLECSHQPHIQGRGAKKRTQRAG